MKTQIVNNLIKINQSVIILDQYITTSISSGLSKNIGKIFNNNCNIKGYEYIENIDLSNVNMVNMEQNNEKMVCYNILERYLKTDFRKN